MNRQIHILLVITFIGILFSTSVVSAKTIRWIRVGNYQLEVMDNLHMGNGGGQQYYYHDNFNRRIMNNCGLHLGVKDWYDENDNYIPYRIANVTTGTFNEAQVIMPVPNEDGSTIKKYMRYDPPAVTVDGVLNDDALLRRVDEVAPDKIPGTADVMVESYCNTWTGISIRQKVYGWSQKYHDDYAIYDFTFIHTGNTDLDEEIELPEDSLTNVYFMGVIRANNDELFFDKYGYTPGDSIRIMYSYFSRSAGADYDNTGRPHPETGYMERPYWKGRTWLHVDQSVHDPTDNVVQPHMTGVGNPQWLFSKVDASSNSDENIETLYKVMERGFEWYNGVPIYEPPDAYANTYHSVSMGDRGMKFNEELGFGGRGQNYGAVGPYYLAPGDSFRVVWADVAATLSPEKNYQVSTAWKAGTAADTWDDYGSIPDNLPIQYQNYPDLAPTENDVARDAWYYTGQDSMFSNAYNAQWNLQNGYDIPTGPPPPAVFEVNSQPDRISLTWEPSPGGNVQGYRIYRAEGDNNARMSGNELIGTWSRIADVDAGTRSYDDATAERGQSYYYYITAYDDGSGNTGVDGKDRGVLESGKYLTRTNHPASLTRAPGESLADIRVVPNPFNISAVEMQYTGEPNKIIFMELPPQCTITIYTVTGDLVKVIEHTDGSGDEPWGDIFEEQQVTQSGQVVVSGVYIAHIETPDGQSKTVKFAIVR